jgi:hypothetical protein
MKALKILKTFELLAINALCRKYLIRYLFVLSAATPIAVSKKYSVLKAGCIVQFMTAGLAEPFTLNESISWYMQELILGRIF